MIIYGSRATHTHSEQKGALCSHCGQTKTHTISIFGKYAHIYWLPLFPIGKTGVSECNTCKTTLAPEDMNSSLKMAYDEVYSNAKPPIWYWTGLSLVAVLIITMAINNQKHKTDVVDFVAAPQVGDLYECKPEEYYSLLKVMKVTSDSVFVVENEYGVDKQSHLDEIDESENYSSETFGFSREEIKLLFEDKTILDIKRD